MRFPSPLCWLRTTWATLTTFAASGDPTPVMGHRYVEDFKGPAEISVLVCRECGDVSVGWVPLAPRAELEQRLQERTAECKARDRDQERLERGFLELAAGDVISHSKAAVLIGCTHREVREKLRRYMAAAPNGEASEGAVRPCRRCDGIAEHVPGCPLGDDKLEEVSRG